MANSSSDLSEIQEQNYCNMYTTLSISFLYWMLLPSLTGTLLFLRRKRQYKQPVSMTAKRNKNRYTATIPLYIDGSSCVGHYTKCC